MKKRIALILVIIFVLSCLSAACINLNNRRTNSRLTTVRVWSGQAGSKVVYTKLVDEWNKTVGREKGIFIQYEVFPATEYWNMARDAIEKGTTPDILRISGSKKTFAENGDIVPIEDFPGGEQFVKDYGEPLLEGKEIFGGKTYFVNGEVTTYALIYNKDMFKRYGIVDASGKPLVPKTMSEYIHIAARLTHPEDGCYGIGIPLKGSTYSSALFTAPFDSCIDSPVNYDEGTKDYTSLRYAFEWLSKVKKSSCYFPGAENLDNDMMRSQFAAGRIGMFIGASWDVGVLTQQFPTECDWGVAPLPIVEGYQKFTDIASITSGFCIGKNALNNDREKVMEVFKFLHSQKHHQNLYEAGAVIPRRPEIMKDADLSNTPVQWEAFADQYTEIAPRYNVPTISIKDITLDEAIDYIWNGEKTVSEVIFLYEDAFRRAYRDAVESRTFNVEEAKRIAELQQQERK